MPGAGRENASLRLQRMSFALKTMGGATVGSAITTAGLGDWDVSTHPEFEWSEVPSSFGLNLWGEILGKSPAVHGLLGPTVSEDV